MSEIVKFLMSVHDPRDHRKVHHLLSDIVLLIFFAGLAGAEYWEEIEDFGQAFEPSLRAILKLDNGILFHDTMQRVFATLDSQVLVTVTMMWSNLLEETRLSASTFPTFTKSLLAIDGKTIKGNVSSTQKHCTSCRLMQQSEGFVMVKWRQMRRVMKSLRFQTY